MSYLLDTHALLWWWADDPKLSADARKVIATEPVWVSTAVVWEMLIKKNLGKLKIPDAIDRQLHAENFNVLDIKLPHVMALDSLAGHHSDPFDRIQIAQARAEALVFITKDRRIQEYQEIDVLPA
jgi:PIN domain nuclease of toxin-antitoxin system